MQSIYAEAFDRLLAAIDQEAWRGRTAIHPFATLFRGTERFIMNGGDLSDAQKNTLHDKIDAANRRFPRDAEINDLSARLVDLIG
jgi:hypothetical protein